MDNPVGCDEVSLLFVSSNESWLNIIVDYEDGSNDGGSIRPQDWIGGSEAGSSDALFGIGRIKRDGTDKIDDSNNVRAVELTVKTDSRKKVSQIRVMNTKWGSVPVLLAVTKKTTGLPTGINDINVNNSNATAGIYTLGGVKVQALQRGINIVKMADGTTRKVLVK